MKPKSLQLDSLTGTVETQSRAAINPDVVADYAERMLAGDKFPPIVVFSDADGGVICNYIGDGFHRVAGAAKAGLKDILADVRAGHQIDALRFSIGSNKSNGLRRTNADKRRCIVLGLENFGDMSHRALAELIGVSNTAVSNISSEIETAAKDCQPLTESAQPAEVNSPETHADDEFATPESNGNPPLDAAKPSAPITPAESQILAGLKALWGQAERVDKLAFGAWANL